jgi:hypothetical protein
MTISPDSASFIEKKRVENRLWRKSEFCGEKKLKHLVSLAADNRQGSTLARSRIASTALSLQGVLGPPVGPVPAPLPQEAPPTGSAILEPFEHTLHLFLASLSAGWSLEDSLMLWAPIDLGSYSRSGRTFFPGPSTPQSPSPVPARDERNVPLPSPCWVYHTTSQEG